MPDQPPLGIVSAIPEELAHLVGGTTRAYSVAGLEFRAGRVAGRPAVLVESGIGKVNAAIAATLLLDRMGCGGIVFCGVAGGLDPGLGVGDVVVGTRHVQHDYGKLANGELIVYQPGVPPLPNFPSTHGFDGDPGLLARLRDAADGLELPPLDAAAAGGAARRPAIHFGPVVSGDTFINCDLTRQRLARDFGAVAVEMESGAIAQVCSRFGGAPFVNVRCLSDLAGAESHLDFRAFLPAAARIASLVVHRLAPAV